MTTSFNCPKCAAPLDYYGSGDSVHCPYCGNTVIVPPELRGNLPAADNLAAAAQQPSNSQLSPEQLQEIMTLLRDGKKIEAIKVYRMATLAGLVEAKNAVEAMDAARRGLSPTPPQTTGTASPTSAQLDAIKRALGSGQKLVAIKLFREATGAGFKEAKDAVEAIETANPELRVKAQPSQASQAKKSKVASLVVALFFFGIASIFPLVFTPMGMEAWQLGEYVGAIISFGAALIWAVVWGGIGAMILFS